MRRRFIQALIALPLLTLFACTQAIYVPGEKQPPTNEDVAETGPGSLKVDVRAYQWIMINGTTHMKVIGEVVNNSGRPLQGLRLIGILHDQDGTPIAHGASYIYPTYLPAGGVGSFEFVGLNKRERGLKHTRLITTVSANSLR
ncbi:MAG: hypothetical protein LBS60_02720 [Deltaproteobacteria bacterium]|jgi:hypothetical protein|nr:hypothetical protein [Deltaproteobacteria bacterium]